MKRLPSVLFAIFLCSTANAVDKTGTMAAKFLSTDIGSRAIGMGGAFTSIANDGSSMYWNPAGIGFNSLRKFYVNHSNWIADVAFDYFSISIPLATNRYLGINITSVSMGEMEVTRYGNEDTGEKFSASDHAFGLTYALNLTDRFSIGFNGKLIQEKNKIETHNMEVTWERIMDKMNHVFFQCEDIVSKFDDLIAHYRLDLLVWDTMNITNETKYDLKRHNLEYVSFFELDEDLQYLVELDLQADIEFFKRCQQKWKH